MRSISTKLIAAFVVIGLVSILSIVLLARWTTRNEFDRFIVDRRGQDIVATLGQYYAQHGTWAGIPENLVISGGPSQPAGQPGPHPPFIIVDASGKAVQTSGGFSTGEQVSQLDIKRGIPIEVNGNRVGTLVITRAPVPNTPREAEFIKRINLLYWYSAIGASLLALLLGAIISRSLTRPIRELTNAAHAISAGNFEQQVPVRSRDEMGELAQAFNRMSQELSRSTNLRRQMTADIAHELRTPLSLILGHAEAVHDGVLPPSAENFEIIREEAGRLEHLIDDLRTLSLADAGELSMNFQGVAPERLLRDIALLYSYQAQHKQVTLMTQAATALPDLQIDPGRITQVVTNILDNALRHTPAGGSITIAARPHAEGIEISISDTGPGLAPDDLGRVFDRFYRADAARNRSEGGSGLGLAIARSIIQAHGGQIRAESQPGAGLMVIITLPATS